MAIISEDFTDGVKDGDFGQDRATFWLSEGSAQSPRVALKTVHPDFGHIITRITTALSCLILMATTSKWSAKPLIDEKHATVSAPSLVARRCIGLSKGQQIKGRTPWPQQTLMTACFR
jgi:hypothetical protein